MKWHLQMMDKWQYVHGMTKPDIGYFAVSEASTRSVRLCESHGAITDMLGPTDTYARRVLVNTPET